MRVAVLSDIHGNKQALHAVVNDARNWGAVRWIIAGDIVGYGADPGECVNMIRELGAECVAGNHDWGTVGKTPIDNFNSAARKAILWTREQLDDESCQFLANLPLVHVSSPVTVSHANFKDPASWEYVFTLFQAQVQFSGFRTRIGIIGHSHFPFYVSEGKDGGWANQLSADQVSWKNRSRRFLINAGSVGQPRDGDPRACYVRIDLETGIFGLERVAYDIHKAQQRIISSDLPSSLAERLEQGR